MEKYDLATRLAKKDSGKFDWNDLSPWIQKKVDPNSKVFHLPIGKWIKVGNIWLLNQEIRNDLDDAFVRVLTRVNVPFLNWLILPFAALRKGEWVMWCNKIPHTDLIIEVWFVGDGSQGFALVAESR